MSPLTPRVVVTSQEDGGEGRSQRQRHQNSFANRMTVATIAKTSTTKPKVVRPADMFLLGFSATLVLIFLNVVEIHALTTTATSLSTRAVGVVGNLPLTLLSSSPSSKTTATTIATAASKYRTQNTRLFLADGRPIFPTSSPGGAGPPAFGGPPGGPPGFGNNNNAMNGSQQGGGGPPGFGTGTNNSGGGGFGNNNNAMNGSGQRGGAPGGGGGASPFIAGPAGGGGGGVTGGSSFGGQTQSANNFGAPKGGQSNGGFGAPKSTGGFPGKSSAPGFGGGPPGKAASPGFGGGQSSGGFGAPKSAGGFPGKSAGPGFGGGPPGKAASPGFGGGPPGKAASPGFGGGQSSGGGFGAPKSAGGGFNSPKSSLSPGFGKTSSPGFGSAKTGGGGFGNPSSGSSPGFGAANKGGGGFGGPSSASSPGMRGGPRGNTGGGGLGGPPSASSPGFGPGATAKKGGGGFGSPSSTSSPSFGTGPGGANSRGSGNGFGSPGMSTGPRDGGGFGASNGPGMSKGPGRGGMGPGASNSRGGGGGFGSNNGPGMSKGPGRGGGMGPGASNSRGGGGGFGSNNGPGMSKGPGRGGGMGPGASNSRGGGGGFGSSNGPGASNSRGGGAGFGSGSRPGMNKGPNGGAGFGSSSGPGMSKGSGRGVGMGPGTSNSRGGGGFGSSSRNGPGSSSGSRIGGGPGSTSSFEGANGNTKRRGGPGVRGGPGSSTFNGGGRTRPGGASSDRSNRSTGMGGSSSFESRSSGSPFSRDSSSSFGSSTTRDSSRNGFSPSSGGRPGRGDRPDAIPGMDLGQRNNRGFGESRMGDQGRDSSSPYGRGRDDDIGARRTSSGFSRSGDRDRDRMSSMNDVGGRRGINGERGMDNDRSFGRDERRTSSFSRDRDNVGFASDRSRRNKGFTDRRDDENDRFQDRDDDFMGRRQDSDFSRRDRDRMDDYDGGRRGGDPWDDQDRRRIRDLSSPSSSLILFGHPDSRSPIIQWGAYELGLGELQSGNLADNPHPFGKIPCLIDETMVSRNRQSRDRYDEDDDDDDDDEICIFESGAILQYLHDRFYASSNENDDRSRGSGNTRRRRLSPKLSAALSSWIMWANASLEPICFLTNPADGSTIEGTGLHQRRLSGSPIVEMDKLDDYLSEKSKNSRDGGPQYLLGRGHDAFTVADIAVSSYLLFALRFYPDLDLSAWPFVVRFLEDCAGRPTYGRSFGRDVQDRLLLLLRNMSSRGKNRDMLRLPSSSSSKRGRLPSGLTLYGHPSSPENPMIEWAVCELDLKDYLRDGDLRRNPNPLGKVPTLTDQNGKIMVFQVGSILQYFQETYGTRIDGGKITEDDEDVVAQDGAEINSWIVFANTDLESFVKPERLGVEDLRSGKPDGAMSPYARQNQQSGRLVRAGDNRVQMSQQNLEGLDRLDDLLSKKQRDNYERYGGSRKPVYLVGDSFSLADVAVASYLLYLPQSSTMVDLNRWKALKEYMVDCASRDGYAYAFGRKTQAYVLGELESNNSGRVQSGQRPSNNNYRSASPNDVTYNDGPRGTRVFANGATPTRQGQGRSQDDSRGLFRPVV